MLGFNGYDYPNFLNFNPNILLILFLSMLVTFIFKNTNYLIENFNSFNLENNKNLK